MAEGDNKLTRAEFLKMMAAGAVAGVFFKFADLSPLLKPIVQQVNAQQLGSWSLGPRATITPIHLVILATGKRAATWLMVAWPQSDDYTDTSSHSLNRQSSLPSRIGVPRIFQGGSFQGGTYGSGYRGQNRVYISG